MDDVDQISRWIEREAFIQAYVELLKRLEASPDRQDLLELSRKLSDVVRSRCFDLGSSKATEMSLELHELTSLLGLVDGLIGAASGEGHDRLGGYGSRQLRPSLRSRVEGQGTEPIEPTEIVHAVDEVRGGDALEQRYNFVDYQFARDGAYCRARSYADDFGVVTLFGPFDGSASIRKTSSPSLERDVIAYLERRFSTVSRR